MWAKIRFELKQWKLLIVGISLLLVYLLVVASIPFYPYFFNGSVIYPAMPIVHHKLLHVTAAGAIILIIILGARNAPANGLWVRGMLAGSLFVNCCFATYVFIYATLLNGFSHVESIRYDDHVYHISYIYGSDSDMEFYVYTYSVYQCDRLGIICSRIITPYYDATWDDAPSNLDVHFVVGETTDELFVSVDSELHPVPTSPPP